MPAPTPARRVRGKRKHESAGCSGIASGEGDAGERKPRRRRIASASGVSVGVGVGPGGQTTDARLVRASPAAAAAAVATKPTVATALAGKDVGVQVLVLDTLLRAGGGVLARPYDGVVRLVRLVPALWHHADVFAALGFDVDLSEGGGVIKMPFILGLDEINRMCAEAQAAAVRLFAHGVAWPSTSPPPSRDFRQLLSRYAQNAVQDDARMHIPLANPKAQRLWEEGKAVLPAFGLQPLHLAGDVAPSSTHLAFQSKATAAMLAALARLLLSAAPVDLRVAIATAHAGGLLAGAAVPADNSGGAPSTSLAWATPPTPVLPTGGRGVCWRRSGNDASSSDPTTTTTSGYPHPPGSVLSDPLRNVHDAGGGGRGHPDSSTSSSSNSLYIPQTPPSGGVGVGVGNPAAAGANGYTRGNSPPMSPWDVFHYQQQQQQPPQQSAGGVVGGCSSGTPLFRSPDPRPIAAATAADDAAATLHNVCSAAAVVVLPATTLAHAAAAAARLGFTRFFCRFGGRGGGAAVEEGCAILVHPRYAGTAREVLNEHADAGGVAGGCVLGVRLYPGCPVLALLHAPTPDLLHLLPRFSVVVSVAPLPHAAVVAHGGGVYLQAVCDLPLSVAGAAEAVGGRVALVDLQAPGY